MTKDEAQAALRDTLEAYGFGPNNPLILPSGIYDRLAKIGADMTGTIRIQPIPLWGKKADKT